MGVLSRDGIDDTGHKDVVSEASKVIFVELVIGLLTFCPIYAATVAKHRFSLIVNR